MVIAKESPELSIVLPVSNEELVLERKTAELIKYLERTSIRFEVLFVENGSSDNTSRILQLLSEKYVQVRVETTSKRDYSTSLIHGIMSARGDEIITMGIDFADLTVINRCREALDFSDIVICSKNIGMDGRPFMRRIANRSYNALVRAIFGIRFSDIEGYHGLRRRRVQDVIGLIHARAHFFNLLLLLYARRNSLAISEVPLYVTELRRSKFSQGPKIAYLALLSMIEFAKLKGRGF